MADKSTKKLHEEVLNADPFRLQEYMHTMDRILLYSLAVHVMPVDARKSVIKLWDIVTKKSIDTESSLRTHFMEGQSEGRLAKYKGEVDGEELRLYCLKQQELVKRIIEGNLRINEGDVGGEFESAKEDA